ncbi:phenylalanine--tRNA ligase alpha subunit-like isoform X2 [Hylaeus volcanicus]|uniref:phenylalanine--tRNA ligase alpha subunit-like isoform X2 n=1 Tax=Hylaeus volcanicus TaxID=313075 RepID=UPI0023B77AE9|nr:phenylalanine--tRNA ligase alpha subunit-like isoform X2 [Hylaeus volcanicus]
MKLLSESAPLQISGLSNKENDMFQVLNFFETKEPTCTITSTHLAEILNHDHEYVVGLINSLFSQQKLNMEGPHEFTYWHPTEEGLSYCEKGSPENNFLALLRSHPTAISINDLKTKFSDTPSNILDIGLKIALQKKWATLDKITKCITTNSEAPTIDVTQKWLQFISRSTHFHQEQLLNDLQTETGMTKPLIERDILNELKKRKLILSKKIKYYNVTRGIAFSTQLTQMVTDITKEMIQKAGTKIKRGSIHPLIHVANQFKRVLLGMGFQEMPTHEWLENSFWNFDSLFQPQHHPARDMQDTFFIKNPSSSTLRDIDPQYLKDVQQVHEIGGYGSSGWKYIWSQKEASKNVLRTHTTACSSRMLFFLAQELKKTGVFRPKHFFSIDRVFRNETLDATHLAEFHQVEGLICDKKLSLSHLMGVLKTFYSQIGISNLRFKPAYNPYTEPSMEIFGFHPLLKKWIEVGNSGIFRPEMLRPMGFPEDVSVIAWGLSLERPTMIRYHVSNIRELFGHRAIIGMA